MLGTLLKFEANKMFRQKYFYICTLISAAFALLGLFSTDIASVILKVDFTDSIYSGCYYLQTNLGSTNIAIFMAIFTSILVCSEFSHKTFKNIIARGYSRSTFLWSKVYIASIGTSIMIIVNMLVSFTYGTIKYGFGAPSSTLVLSIIAQLVTGFGYTAFFTMLCFITKKTGFSIAMGIVLPTFSSVGGQIINLFYKLPFNIQKILIDSQVVFACDYESTISDLLLCMGVSLAYFVACSLVSIYFMKKYEV